MVAVGVLVLLLCSNWATEVHCTGQANSFRQSDSCRSRLGLTVSRCLVACMTPRTASRHPRASSATARTSPTNTHNSTEHDGRTVVIERLRARQYPAGISMRLTQHLAGYSRCFLRPNSICTRARYYFCFSLTMGGVLFFIWKSLWNEQLILFF